MTKKFYTSVEKYGNTIYLRGYEGGIPIKRADKYKPTLYIPKEGAASGLFSLIGRQELMPKKFDSIKDATKFLDEYKDVHGMEIFGNSNFVAQYIQEKYPDEIQYDMNLINIFMFDIEVDISTGKPNMKTANKPITSIAIKSSKKSEYLLLGLKDYDKYKTETGIDPDKIRFIKFETEEKLLAYFVKYWTDNYPDIVSGWNCEFFDVQYVVTRIWRLFGEDYAKRLSPWGILREVETEKFGKPQYSYKIYGITILDYMDAFKKFGYKYGTQETYKLDHIAHVVLGENKLSYEEYGSLTELYEKNPQKYLDYNLKDTHLIERFEEEIALLSLVVTVAYDGGVNYVGALGTVGIWDTLLYRRLRRTGIVPPVKKGVGLSGSIEGGFVKTPKPGKYKWIVSFDLNSLYPHIMLQFNMSPETILRNGALRQIIKTIKEKSAGHQEENEILKFLDSGRYEEIFSDIGGALLDNSFTTNDLKMFGLCNSLHGYSVGANGSAYDNSFEGIIPQVITEKYAERSVVKKKMLNVENDIEEIKKEMMKRGLSEWI